MAKRFTDTEKWRDDWFSNLSNDYRIIWLYLVDNCSFAGVWKKDFRGLNFNCNVTITESLFNDIFKGRVIEFEKFYFLPKFIIFQYPKGFNSKKPAIVSVKNELEKLNLLRFFDYYNELLIINESLYNDCIIIKDKDKDKETVKDKVKDKDKVKENAEKKVSKKPHLFSESEYFDKELFAKSIEESANPYNNADPDYYYDALLNWSDSGNNKKVNWLATAKNFIQRDFKENKLQSKFKTDGQPTGKNQYQSKSERDSEKRKQQLADVLNGNLKP
jgi:hypothetical protein